MVTLKPFFIEAIKAFITSVNQLWAVSSSFFESQNISLLLQRYPLFRPSLEILWAERVHSRIYLVSGVSLNHKTSLCFCRDTLSLAGHVKVRDPLFG